VAQCPTPTIAFVHKPPVCGAESPFDNKIGRLIQHARYYWLLLAESHLTRRLFADMLRKIAALPSPAG
jgi:hypothetical protein